MQQHEQPRLELMVQSVSFKSFFPCRCCSDCSSRWPRDGDPTWLAHGNIISGLPRSMPGQSWSKLHYWSQCRLIIDWHWSVLRGISVFWLVLIGKWVLIEAVLIYIFVGITLNAPSFIIIVWLTHFAYADCGKSHDQNKHNHLHNDSGVDKYIN